jgi:hypothetical protein
MKAMARHRSHIIEFKLQVAQEFIAGETLCCGPSLPTRKPAKPSGMNAAGDVSHFVS